VQRLPSMDRVERLQDGGNLPPNDALGKRAPPPEPRREVPMLSELHGEAIAHVRPIHVHEPVVDTKRTRLGRQELRKVGFAEPRRDPRADLDADLRGKWTLRRGRREIHFAESTLADESIETVHASGLRAVNARQAR
jgi:hypothetical protein